MSTKGHGHGHGPKEDPLVDMGYEVRDINFPNIAKVTAGFLIFTVVSVAIVSAMFHFNVLGNNSSEDAQAIAKQPRKPMPANTPVLQSNKAAKIDIMTLRKHENEELNTTATLADGSVRIPIDRAMQLLASRGFVATGYSKPANSPGNTITQNAMSPAEIEASKAK